MILRRFLCSEVMCETFGWWIWFFIVSFEFSVSKMVGAKILIFNLGDLKMKSISPSSICSYSLLLRWCPIGFELWNDPRLFHRLNFSRFTSQTIRNRESTRAFERKRIRQDRHYTYHSQASISKDLERDLSWNREESDPILSFFDQAPERQQNLLHDAAPSDAAVIFQGFFFAVHKFSL